MDLKAGFSVQEEVGIRGAVVTSQRVKPDIAIVFEGSPGDDTFAEPYLAQTVMKKAPQKAIINLTFGTHGKEN